MNTYVCTYIWGVAVLDKVILVPLLKHKFAKVQSLLGPLVIEFHHQG